MVRVIECPVEKLLRGDALGGRRGGRVGRRGRLGLLAVALVEAVNAAGRVDELLLAGEERVAGRADFDAEVALARRARRPLLAAGAVDVDLVVVGMNSLLHFYS